MTRKLIAVLIANLFVAPAVLSQETKWEGNIGIGDLYNNVSSGTKDRAKLEEYQDLSNGAAGYFGLTGRGSSYWLNGYGENIGRDDLYIDFSGGGYNTFTYRIYSNWLTHNFGFGPYGGRTPYDSPGGTTQTATFPAFNTGVPPWNSFNYGYDRKDTGASFEWKALTPWYFRSDLSQVNTDGNRLFTPSNGTSPGAGFVELAGPVDYKTNNIALEGGYNTKDAVVALAVLWSNFDNANSTFLYTNAFFAPPPATNFGTQYDTMTLPPDNDYFKVSANGSLRNLPGRSTLSARYTYATSKSEADILPSMLSTGGVYFPTNPSSTRFEGQETINTLSLSWTGNPTRAIDFKAFYNYYDRKNESDEITFGTAAASGLNCTNFATGASISCPQEFYSVKKNNLGLEGYFRLNPSNKFGAGYQYLKQDLEDTPYSSNSDNLFFVEWKTTMIPDSNLWLKYQYSTRSADYLLSNAGAAGQPGPNPAANVLYLERFVGMFNWTERKQNLFKAVFDTSLTDAVGLSLEYIYKDNDYGETTLGRTGDTRNEFYAAVNFGSSKGISGSFFGDYEKVQQKGTHRYINAGSCGGAAGPNCFDPNSPPFPNAYNWSNTNKDTNWLLGVSGSAPLGPVKLTASVLYTRNDGEADITAQVGNPLPINNYDTYKQWSFNLRSDWQINRNWSLAGGYTYQKYTYSDDQYNNYQYLAPPAGSGTPPATLNPSTSYLSGIYANPQYTANILWVIGRYYFR